MATTRCFCVLAIALLAASSLNAQTPPKVGPEFDLLKKMVGDWDFTMKAAGSEFKGAVTYKMDVGGIWLSSSLECELFGSKFFGKGLDTYDAGKKKYVSVWVDSMSTSPTMMEGTHDAAKKTLTLVGEGPSMNGKTTKYKSTSEMPDDNTMIYTMYQGNEKEPSFSIIYKRKK